MSHWLYIMFTTGTRHLVDFDRYYSEQSPTTICGRRITAPWIDSVGDETIIGSSATCATCLKGRQF